MAKCVSAFELSKDQMMTVGVYNSSLQMQTHNLSLLVWSECQQLQMNSHNNFVMTTNYNLLKLMQRLNVTLCYSF